MLLVRVELRQFDWLLKDRVQARDKREFMASAARQLRMIPASGIRRFRQEATPEELARFVFMRQGWIHVYERVARGGATVLKMVCLMLNGRASTVRQRLSFGRLRRRARSTARSFLERIRGSRPVEARLRVIETRLAEIAELIARGGEPVVEVRRVHGQALVFASPDKQGLTEAVRRIEADYYLFQTAIFREGDVVLDVGAHVGVMSIYLAKKYPFIHVYAVEPEPTKFTCLKRNIELNGASNVTAINKAVSGDGLERTLYVPGSGRARATIGRRPAHSGATGRTMPVQTVTLDRLFQEHGIRHCRLLKISAPDVIREALEGLTRTGCVDLVCGEVNLEDCSEARVEAASWRIARQHFWRIIGRRADGRLRSWIHQSPSGIERPVGDARQRL
jgi:FkbM family methyltransferase